MTRCDIDPGAYGNQDCTSISLGFENESSANVPVKSNVLLRHAYVTIITGPRKLWNSAAGGKLSTVCVTVHVHESNPLDFSNPLASRPKYKSSIHHAICLTRSVSRRRDHWSHVLPNGETVRPLIRSQYQNADRSSSLTVHGSFQA